MNYLWKPGAADGRAREPGDCGAPSPQSGLAAGRGSRVGGGGHGAEGPGRAREAGRAEPAEGRRGAEGQPGQRVGKGPAGRGAQAGRRGRRAQVRGGRAWTAPRSALPRRLPGRYPPRPAVPPPPGPARPLTCPVAAAPPLRLHRAARTPAPRAAGDDAGPEASSPSPPPPRVPGAAVTEPRRAPPPPPDTRPGAPPAPRTLTASRPSSGLAPAAPPRDLRAPRRARCLRLAHRPFRERRRPEVAGRADGLERRVRAGAPTAPAGAWPQGVAAPPRVRGLPAPRQARRPPARAPGAGTRPAPLRSGRPLTRVLLGHTGGRVQCGPLRNRICKSTHNNLNQTNAT